MERCLRWGTLALMLCWSLPALAQNDGFEDSLNLKFGAATPAKPEFITTLTPATAKSGDEVTLTVQVKLPKGYYIYGMKGDFGGRTQIVTAETGLEVVDATFTPNHEEILKPEPLLDNVELSKFHDEVTWKKRFRITKDFDPAQVSIKGKLTGMYCSEGTDEVPGGCIPIRPAHEFVVALENTAEAPAVKFEFEDFPKTDKKKLTRLFFKLSPTDAKPGDKVTLSIAIELEKGWHTYSMKPLKASEPTDIDLSALSGLKPLGTSFEPDRAPTVETPEPDVTQEVFHDHVVWTREFEVLPGTKPATYGVKGQIIFQKCNLGGCVLFKVPFSIGDVSQAIPVAAESPDVPNEARAAEVAPPAKISAKPAGLENVPKPQDQGLLGFILTAVGAGFLALLTPCVWPMVPITVSFFLKQSESEHHRPALTALVFCGSIVGTFTILGVGVSALYGGAELNKLANSPWMNVVIGIVFFVFAFNMLGLFEIRIPSSLLTFTANKEQAGGYLGAMFMALTFTLTSFTCTFAFAGSLLVMASQGQYYWPIIGMLAFGMAFASPFFVLAQVPSILKKLPKSGGWMNAVKVVMGLVELGAAIKFFSVADFKWTNANPILFDYVFVMITWMVLSLMISLYLLGVFRLAHDTPPAGISVFRMVLVMGFFGLTATLAVALFNPKAGGGLLMDQIIAFAPPRFNTAPVAHVPAGRGSDSNLPEPSIATEDGLRFALDVDKAIPYAVAAKQPMLFDFTGVNCLNCRRMERKMSQTKNRTLLEKFVLVQLYTDTVPNIGNNEEVDRLLKRNQDLQIQWFNDATLPAYAIVTPDGKTILSTFLGLELQDGKFAEFMDQGLKKWEEMQKSPAPLKVVNRP